MLREVIIIKRYGEAHERVSDGSLSAVILHADLDAITNLNSEQRCHV